MGERGVTTKLLVLGAAVLIAWGLKRYYADARTEDLWWVLSPTARVVSVMTGAVFTLEPGEGYLSRDRLFLIEKACAGINFVVAAFGMLVVALFHRVGHAASGLQVLGVSLLASYAAAVVVNSVRIAVAMWLADHPAALSAYSATEVHRVEGIAVYFGGLVVIYEIAQRLDRRAFAISRKRNAVKAFRWTGP
jgi:exosortase K